MMASNTNLLYGPLSAAKPDCAARQGMLGPLIADAALDEAAGRDAQAYASRLVRRDLKGTFLSQKGGLLDQCIPVGVAPVDEKLGADDPERSQLSLVDQFDDDGRVFAFDEIDLQKIELDRIGRKESHSSNADVATEG